MKRFVVALVVLVVLFLTLYIYWTIGNLPPSAFDKSQKIFVIQKGASIREIGNSLAREGLIRDPVVFFVYIKLYGQDRKIQAGDYRLSPSMNLAKIIDELNRGTLDRWITIPEGYRAEEIADILQKNIPSYEDLWRDTLNENEGYLFPDTYLVPRDADIAMVVSIMRNNFNSKIQELGLTINDPGITKTITIASLIEREAQTIEEKPLIAGVIKNRLDIGMKLDIDATIQYALGFQKDENRWWKKGLTTDDLALISPYNTYRNAGLPPTPIANPGIEAIKAALNPADHNYFYYLHANGKIYPARTIEEHNANIKKYLEN